MTFDTKAEQSSIIIESKALKIIAIFDDCFAQCENTRLTAGQGEPVYIPSHHSGKPYHQLEFAHGFARSALHEIAHWCIAGAERRKLLDYGYWYEPDGRNVQQQLAFEQVEVKPQALEWIFSKLCDLHFQVSVDNLNGETTDSQPFMFSVVKQAIYYVENGLPTRAEQFAKALMDNGDIALEKHCNLLNNLRFSISELRL